MATAAAPPARPPVAPPRPQVGPPAPPVRQTVTGPAAPQMQMAPPPPQANAPGPQIPTTNLAAPPMQQAAAAQQTQVESTAAPQQGVVTPPTGTNTAPAAPEKKRRSGGRKAETLPPYYGLFVYDDAGQPVMLVTADGSYPQRQKLKALPTDYDPAVSAKLKPSDFDSELLFMEFQISQTEAKLSGMKARYETIQKLGAGAGAKAASNLLKYQKQFAGLRAQLASQGIDVDALLAAGG